jgi:signal transduction histidine kinase
MPVPEGTHEELALAWAAHELRRDLAAVSLALQAGLAMERLDDARELVGRAEMAARTLADEMSALLDWASGRMPMHRTSTDLVELTRAVALVHSSSVVPVGVHARGPVRAHVDRAQVRSAVGNLLANAARHARSTVSVQVRARDGRAAISVADDGPGVPAEDRVRIFDPFVRGASAVSAGGAGMGLYIARKVAEAHEGGITCSAVPVGALFVLDLPQETL